MPLSPSKPPVTEFQLVAISEARSESASVIIEK
jgi:hypothetical protein